MPELTNDVYAQLARHADHENIGLDRHALIVYLGPNTAALQCKDCEATVLEITRDNQWVPDAQRNINARG